MALLPDGRRRWLIHIKDWDLSWQAVYRYAQPIVLPKGTRVQMRWSYDNSVENPRNPSAPPARVVAGNVDLFKARAKSFAGGLEPLLAARHEEAQRFDTLFDAYWLRRGVKRGGRPAPAGPARMRAYREP